MNSLSDNDLPKQMQFVSLPDLDLGRHKVHFRGLVGTAISGDHHRDIEVHTSGGGYAPTRVSSTTHRTTSIWIRADNGQDTQVTLYNKEFNFLPGHRIVAIFAQLGKGWHPYQIINLNTGYYNETEPMLELARAIGIPGISGRFYIAARGLIGFLALCGIFPFALLWTESFWGAVILSLLPIFVIGGWLDSRSGNAEKRLVQHLGLCRRSAAN